MPLPRDPMRNFTTYYWLCCGSPVACCWATTAFQIPSEHTVLYSILMLKLRIHILTCSQRVLHAEHDLGL